MELLHFDIESTAMSVWFFAVVVVGVLAGLLIHLFSKGGEKLSPFVKKQLLTPNELHFYKRLVEAAGPERVVLCQVSMGALMDNRKGGSDKRSWALRAKYSQKIVDFVVCDAETMDVEWLVELDDRTHSKVKDAERDMMTRSAGYRTLRFESKKKPTVSELVVLLRKPEIKG